MRNAYLLYSSLFIALAACSANADAPAAPDGRSDDASVAGGDAGKTVDASAGDAASANDGSKIVDAGFIPELDAGPSSTRQRAISKDTTTAPNGFYEYLPGGYNGALAAPLLVFWHGLGENGNGLMEADGGGDLHKVPANGPPKLIAASQWPNARPFIVLSPQHGPTDCPSNDEIDAFMTWAIGHYTVDRKRIYLTGLSCGAIGSWSYLTKYKDKVVAAALLISGDPGNAWSADGCGLVANMSLWSVHGSADPTVNVGPDEADLTHLLACPAPRADVKWNLVNGGGHDVWTQTYDLSAGYGDVYAWMLAHPKP